MCPNACHGDNQSPFHTIVCYVDVLRNAPGWPGQIERSGAQYILWPNIGYGGSFKGQELIQSGRWQFIYQDSVSFLMGKLPLVEDAQYSPAPVTPYTHLGIAQLGAIQGNYESAIAMAKKTRVEQWPTSAYNARPLGL